MQSCFYRDYTFPPHCFAIPDPYFISPVSCFDEKLAEDRRVNRLEDSYMLWKSVCACKLLARTQLVLCKHACLVWVWSADSTLFFLLRILLFN